MKERRETLVFYFNVATIALRMQRMDACSLQPIVQVGTKRVNPRERLEKKSF